MMINKIGTFIKELLTKADKTDRVITYENGDIGLKDPLPYKTEPKEELPHNMCLHSTRMKKGLYRVNGVVIPADTMTESIRKYSRAKGDK